MIVKNNYKECLTNLACSIRKYFDLDIKHNSIEYIDNLLNEKKPKNVVLILLDGMGSRILDRTLAKDAFFRKNKKKEITTVFPATTTAATASIRTGLNPVEHGWLGWHMYIAPIDETIALFKDSTKGKEEQISDKFLKIKSQLVQKTIADEINEKTNNTAVEISPFSQAKYESLENMLEMIKKECYKDGKKYIYAYDVEPDHTMHDLGPDNEIVKKLIQTRNDKIEKLCKELQDTIVIITADHGHTLVESIYLEKQYPQIINMLERTTSLEPRAVSFKIKEGYKQEFIEEFNKNLGKDFTLYDKQEIIDSQLFGDGVENKLYKEALGDFIAIAEASNKCIITDGDKALKSQHAGYSEDEIYVPLIIIDKTESDLKK